MPPKSITEKSTRTYRSDLRRQQAEATRNRILQAAAELFAADGYTRTTLAGIATVAGVSAETVQGQGPKAALLIAAMDYAAFGVVGEDDVFNLEYGRGLVAFDDVASTVDHLVGTVAALNARTARLYLTLTSGANSEPKLRDYLRESFASITLQASRILDVYRQRGWVLNDVPFDELVETVTVLTSIDTYLAITDRNGRTVEHYRQWLRRMLLHTVFADVRGT